jgi:hypothetical protein|tara:strand:- start:2198 stop:2617 length:420 start_codon:yes stop_codon:yes gene_type:complete
MKTTSITSKRVTNSQKIDTLVKTVETLTKCVELLMSEKVSIPSKESVTKTSNANSNSNVTDVLNELVASGLTELRVATSQTNEANDVLGFIPKNQWTIMKSVMKAHKCAFTYPKLGFKGGIPKEFVKQMDSIGVTITRL